MVFLFSTKEKAPFIAHQYVSRPWAKTAFFLFGLRVIIKGKEHLDRKQTYVFIANHRSQLDIPAYAIASGHTIRFLAKAELTKLPLMGYVIKNLYISVDRKDKEARARSMDQMLLSIKEGISVFICPEGTRNRGAEPLLPLRDGAFRLAIEAQVPVCILVIKNSGNLLSPIHPIALSPGKIYCTWLKPIPTVGMNENDLEKLKEEAVKRMTEELQQEDY